jgi:hypothetical protein
MAEAPRTVDPDGRDVVFDAGSYLHLARRRPWLLDHIDAIMLTVARPDYRMDDPDHAGRERFYLQHLDLQRWLRVVVDFNESPGWIVTAAVQDNDPRG